MIVLLEYIDFLYDMQLQLVKFLSHTAIYSLPIMLALCLGLMLSSIYYAKNYASVIGRGQHIVQCASKNTKGIEVVAM